MKFLILNGPNINLARWSEPGVPGEVDYTGLMDYVQAGCDQLGIETDICQSNHDFFMFIFYTGYCPITVSASSIHYSTAAT